MKMLVPAIWVLPNSIFVPENICTWHLIRKNKLRSSLKSIETAQSRETIENTCKAERGRQREIESKENK